MGDNIKAKILLAAATIPLMLIMGAGGWLIYDLCVLMTPIVVYATRGED